MRCADGLDADPASRRARHARPISCSHNRDGSPVPAAPHPVLPTDRVRHVGTAVAFVIAETVAQAKDAAEHVVVDYEPLPAVTDAKAADRSRRAAALRRFAEYHDRRRGRRRRGDRRSFRARRSRHAARHLDQSRHRRADGAARRRRHLRRRRPAATRSMPAPAASCARRKRSRRSSACRSKTCASSRRRSAAISAPRNSFFPEFALVVWGSRRVGRPVKWTADRSEAFVSDYMGRDLTVSAELALDADGRFLALRTLKSQQCRRSLRLLRAAGQGRRPGDLRLPHSDVAHVQARAVLSTTMCTTPYRSAGRPEVIYVIERLIDKAAQEHGFDRVALAQAQSHSAVGISLQESRKASPTTTAPIAP